MSSKAEVQWKVLQLNFVFIEYESLGAGLDIGEVEAKNETLSPEECMRGHCYGLNLKCPLQTHVLNVCSLTGDTIWGDCGTFRR